MKYALINESGFCWGISNLTGEIDAPGTVQLSEEEDVQIGDSYLNGVWTRPEPSQVPGQPQQPEKSLIPKVEDLFTELREARAELQATRADNLAIMAALAALYESPKGGTA